MSDFFFPALKRRCEFRKPPAADELAGDDLAAKEAETLIAGGDIRSLDSELGEADRFSNGPAASVLPTHDSLVDFAKNCGASYLYVFDDCDWTHRKL